MLKRVVRLNKCCLSIYLIFVKLLHILLRVWWRENKKLFDIFFGNIKNVFTVTFDQLNVTVLNQMTWKYMW